jgi:MFS family permease
LVGYITIPDCNGLKQKIPKNMSVVILFIGGLLMMMTALNEIGHWGVSSFAFLSLMTGGILLTGLFSIIEYRTTNPILDLHLLVRRDFGLLNIVRIILNIVYFALLFLLSLFLQNIIGYSAIQAGFILLCLTLVFGVVSIPAGKWVDKVGVKKPCELGMLLLGLSCILFSLVTLSISPIIIVIALVLAGLGIGFSIPASGTAVLYTAPLDKLGAAMGIFFTTSFMGSSLGVALSGLMLELMSKYKLNLILQSNHSFIDTIDYEKLQAMASGLSPIDLNNILHGTATAAFTFSFALIMITCALLSFLAVGLMKKIKIKSL